MGYSGAMTRLSAHFTAGSSQLMHWRSVRPERVTTGTICFPHFGQCVIRSMRSSRFFPSNLELEFLFHSSVSAEGPMGIGAALLASSRPHEPTGPRKARPDDRLRRNPPGFARLRPHKGGGNRRSAQRSDSIFKQQRFAISPRDPREFCQNLPLSETEGAGNAGRAMRPQPRMQNKISIRV